MTFAASSRQAPKGPPIPSARPLPRTQGGGAQPPRGFFPFAIDNHSHSSLNCDTRPSTSQFMPRTNFSDDQRAAIYVLDRATCAYSGRSLWIPDYGVDPGYAIDWADHLVPASRGGRSEVSNGAAASWIYNYLRGNAAQRLLFFHRGIPTPAHALHRGVIEPSIAANLRRFAALHSSDWFLNRAMWHIWIALTLEHERSTGLRRSRDYRYYVKASMRALQRWRRLVELDSVEPLEQRALLLPAPAADQLALLSVRTAKKESTLVELMHALYPTLHASAKLIADLGEATSRRAICAVIEKAQSLPSIPQRIRDRVAGYAKTLNTLIHK
jgi:hypothetical protein